MFYTSSKVFMPLSKTLYNFCICYFLPPCEVREGVVCRPSVCASSFMLLSALICISSFTEKFYCSKINLALCLIAIITVLVKLLQVIWGLYY